MPRRLIKSTRNILFYPDNGGIDIIHHFAGLVLDRSHLMHFHLFILKRPLSVDGKLPSLNVQSSAQNENTVEFVPFRSVVRQK